MEKSKSGSEKRGIEKEEKPHLNFQSCEIPRMRLFFEQGANLALKTFVKYYCAGLRELFNFRLVVKDLFLVIHLQQLVILGVRLW